jgi:hypothetical protein
MAPTEYPFIRDSTGRQGDSGPALSGLNEQVAPLETALKKQVVVADLNGASNEVLVAKAASDWLRPDGVGDHDG